MTPAEVERIQASMAALREAVQTEDHALIREQIDRLDEATRRLAELRMNYEVQKALAGRSLDEASQP